jgi:hypothetical protein
MMFGELAYATRREGVVMVNRWTAEWRSKRIVVEVEEHVIKGIAWALVRGATWGLLRSGAYNTARFWVDERLLDAQRFADGDWPTLHARTTWPDGAECHIEVVVPAGNVIRYPTAQVDSEDIPQTQFVKSRVVTGPCPLISQFPRMNLQRRRVSIKRVQRQVLAAVFPTGFAAAA